MYRHPQGSRYFSPDAFGEMNDFLDSLIQRYPSTDLLVLGDMNARIGTEQEIFSYFDHQGARTNARKSKDSVFNNDGQELLELCESFNLEILNGNQGQDIEGELTFISNNGGSVIDYALLSRERINNLLDFSIEIRAESDHLPVCVLLKISATELHAPVERTVAANTKDSQRFLWKEEKREGFVESILRSAGRAGQIQPPGEQAILLGKRLRRAGATMRSWGRGARAMTQGWFTEACRKSRRETVLSLRKFRSLGTVEARNSYLLLRRQYEATIKEAKKSWQENEAARIEAIIRNEHNKSIWDVIKALRIKVNEQNEISADAWVEYFSRTLSNTGPQTGTFIFTEQSVIELDLQVTWDEVNRAILATNIRKAGGADGIPTKFITELWNIDSECILILFNSIMDTGEYPETWNTALLQPIFKNKGDRNSPDNYRGISLLPAISKLFCKILNSRLSEWAEKHNKISKLQAGFRRGFATTDNIFVLDTLVRKALSRKRGHLYCSFVDFEKAFDSINREALWQKLSKLGVSRKILNVLQSMYREVNFCVRCCDGNTTHIIKSTVGVRQGCPLSPLLFILFINDLVTRLEEADTSAPKIDSLKIPGLLYADDLVLCSETVEGLQVSLNILERYSETWGLKVNIQKTKIVVFKNGFKWSKNEKWKYVQEELDRAKTFTYLGAKFSMNGGWHKHIAAAQSKGRIALKEIASAVRRVPDLPLKVCDTMFKTLVLPAMNYGAEIWGVDRIDRLECIETDYYILILGVSKSAANVGVLREVGSVGIWKDFKMKSIKLWSRLACDQGDTLIHRCFKEQLQENDHRFWTNKVKFLLERAGLGNTLTEIVGNRGTREVERLIAGRLSDIKRQDILAATSEKRSLVVQCYTSPVWGCESYIHTLRRDARGGYAWFRTGGWMQRRIKDLNGTGICVLCGDEEDWIHILLNCCATESWRGKWIGMGNYCVRDRNITLAREILRDNRAHFMKELGNFLGRIRTIRETAIREWENSAHE